MTCRLQGLMFEHGIVGSVAQSGHRQWSGLLSRYIVVHYSCSFYSESFMVILRCLSRLFGKGEVRIFIG